MVTPEETLEETVRALRKYITSYLVLPFYSFHSRNLRTYAGKVFDQSRESGNVLQALNSREFGTLSDNGD